MNNIDDALDNSDDNNNDGGDVIIADNNDVNVNVATDEIICGDGGTGEDNNNNHEDCDIDVSDLLLNNSTLEQSMLYLNTIFICCILQEHIHPL